MTPNGSFTREPSRAARAISAAFAAGSGITPVLSIAATALERDPDSRFQLYYGNTSTRADDVPRRRAGAQGPVPDALLGRAS